LLLLLLLSYTNSHHGQPHCKRQWIWLTLHP
jgi:hypothetical protein